MRLIKPRHVILSNVNGERILKSIEAAGRTCYKSEGKITPTSARALVTSVINRGHESVIEHESISVRFICDRGVTHEMVRHRIAAFSQESTRYCDYGGKDIEFVIPPWVNVPVGRYNVSGEVPMCYSMDRRWAIAMLDAETEYNILRINGWSPQQARAVLPNSLKTEIVMTANLREWRHVMKLRTAKDAHPQMRELMFPLLMELRARVPVVFDDIPVRGE